MKNRTTLVLMEQLIMLLVFSLAAAACLGIFAGASRIRSETRQLDDAVIICRNGAEAVKACRGDLEQTALLLGGSAENGTVCIRYNAERVPDPEGCYLLTVCPVPTQLPTLGQAQIRVDHTAQPEQVIYSVTVGWQEVAP